MCKIGKIAGCGTALVTPFKGGQVDYQAYKALVQRQVASGIHFLVPLGTTAETPCLEKEEKLQLVRLTRECAPKLPLLVGVGTNSYTATLANMELMASEAVDAFLVVVPYYNKPTQEGQYQYFKSLAQQSTKPIFIYNVPGRTGVNMTAQTTLRLAQLDNIVGIKEASSNYAQISEIIRNAPKDFTVLSGNDDETLSLMATGASGVISVASNIAPRQVVDLVEAAVSGDFAKASSLHHRLTPLFKNCFVESNPIPVKAGMNAMGLLDNELRLPLVPATESTYKLMQKTIQELGL